MAEGRIWLDGALVPIEAAHVPVTDRAFTVGDGVFESLRADGGVPFALRRHLARLRRSAERVGLTVPWSDEELRAAVAAVLAAEPRDHARVRITVSAGTGPVGTPRGAGRPTVVVTAAPSAPRPPTTAVCTAPWPRNERSPLAGVKSTSYGEMVLALAHAEARGCGEALLATTTGLLSEATGSNVFVVLGGRLVTPPLSSGCLPGVTRALVLELTDAVEEDVPMAALAEADEVFLTSTTRRVQAVHELDGRPLHPAPGPVTAAVRDALEDLVRRTAEP